MDKPQIHSTTFAGIILLIFALVGMYLGYVVLRGVFVPVLFASLFAVIFYPFYQWLSSRIHSQALSALLCNLILVLIVLSVFSLVIYLAVGQVVSITKVFSESLDWQRIEIFTDQEQLQILVNDTISSINALLQRIPFVDASAFSAIVEEVLKSVPPLLQELSTSIIKIVRVGFNNAASLLLDMIIFFISFFFLLMDGKKFIEYLYKALPINALHERQISKRFTNLCYAWIVVNIVLAFLQGSVATIGYALIGVPSPLIWGLVTALAAFIPFIGAGLVWSIIGLVYLITGNYFSALEILILGLIVSGGDNLLRPFFLKEGIKIHPLIVFLAVFGGFFAFGVPGLIVGPIIMVFISTLLYIYELEFGESLKSFHDGKNPKRP